MSNQGLTDSNQNYNKSPDKNSPDSPSRRRNFHLRLNTYNKHFEGSPNLQIRTKQVDGGEVLIGQLHIHWGVNCPIQLKQKDESTATPGWRRSYCMAMSNGLDEEFLQMDLDKTLDNGGGTLKGRRASLDDLLRDEEKEESEGDKFGSIRVRPGSRRRRLIRQKRLSIINGHLFDADTSVFTPSHGSVTSVTVTSNTTTPHVIRHLLAKFKVENNPDDFCLTAVKKSGEKRILKETDCPLVEKIMMGPLEDVSKILITERGSVRNISEEVAHYVGLPRPVLDGFLNKIQSEEDRDIKLLKIRFARYKKKLQERMSASHA